MVHHIRRFVHGQGCVQIVLKELDSPVPGYQHTILTYSWCRLCKQVSMWTSESLLFQFSVLVVTGFVWKSSILRKCSRLELWLNGRKVVTGTYVLMLPTNSSFRTGALRVKNLVWGSLVRRCQNWLWEDRSKQKKWSYSLIGEEYGLLQWIFMSIWERADIKTYWRGNWQNCCSLICCGLNSLHCVNVMSEVPLVVIRK